jgi:predicted ribosome quality control (RQC) complex YloA/Tae2 family protein
VFFDALTTAAMADELGAALEGGRVQGVVLAGRLALGLEIYAGRQRRHVLLSAETEHPRVQLAGDKVRRGPEAPAPLLLLMRKYVRGARLVRVSQPDFERILSFEFVGSEGPVTLLAEIMGRRSNLILLSPDGTIMEAIKRVTPEQSRRPVLPQHRYEPPPPLLKPSIASLTPSRLGALLAEAQGSLTRRLVQAVAGMSPLLAREVVFRATGNAEADEADPEALVAVSRSLLVELPATHEWTPCVGLEEGQVVAYAPYELTHLPAQQAMPGMSQAIQAYVEAQGAQAPYAAAVAAVRRLLGEARERELRRRAAIQRDVRPEEEINRLREYGEWVLACATQIEPGQRELAVEGMEGRPLQIPLDPKRTPVENARHYFREYDNARSAVEGAPQRLAAVDQALAHLNQLETDLQLAENRADIDQVRSALIEAGYVRVRRPGPRARAAGPRRLEAEEGFVIWAGRNSRQNVAVLQRAAPGDLWLHARGVPGGHVILVTGGRPVPEALLERAAALAAYYSAARDEPQVQVDVTERRYVRPIRGAGPGQVTYRNERTLQVRPARWQV